MKSAREMIDKRLTIQEGFFKGARITITEAIAKELMENYHKQPYLKTKTMKTGETIYTYYRVEFKDCGLDYDFTIVENIKEIQNLITMCDSELDDPDKEAQIIITGIGMTKTQFKEYQLTEENEL